MRKLDKRYLDVDMYRSDARKPNFNNLLKVLKREIPERSTLFEFYVNDDTCGRLSGMDVPERDDVIANTLMRMEAFKNAGYDYVTLHGSDFCFKTDREQGGHASVSMNKGSMIHERESFEKYEWPDPDAADYSRLERLREFLPEGMKLIVYGPNGVLETVVSLVGYEDLCYMIKDDPELVQDIFDAVGSRFVRYYEISAGYDSVGALLSNDDWGFNTQTMLAVNDMRKYVFPWHKKIVDTIHKIGKPVILHSCGKLDLVMNDIIDDMKYDGKHSNEDKILPVEKGYAAYSERIAILGGLDLDFICRSTPEEVYERASAMLEAASAKGGYALGSGNSIPEYVPGENYLAMIAAARWYGSNAVE